MLLGKAGALTLEMDGLLYYLSLTLLKFPGYLIQNLVYCNGVSIKLYSHVMSHTPSML